MNSTFFPLRKSKQVHQLPTLHCTVVGFALDWESHKSLKHDCECLTALLECAFFQPYAIQKYPTIRGRLRIR